jgi:hypothetical protein
MHLATLAAAPEPRGRGRESRPGLPAPQPAPYYARAPANRSRGQMTAAGAVGSAMTGELLLGLTARVRL